MQLGRFRLFGLHFPGSSPHAVNSTKAEAALQSQKAWLFNGVGG
jgi:hypothetical protein